MYFLYLHINEHGTCRFIRPFLSYENVWKVTEGVYSDICVKDGWIGRDVLDIADMNILTHKVRTDVRIGVSCRS